MAKRKFRIVKRENNIPVLGVCECCSARFTADPETIGRPQDAHTFIQKQFIAHKCKRQRVATSDSGVLTEPLLQHAFNVQEIAGSSCCRRPGLRIVTLHSV